MADMTFAEKVARTLELDAEMRSLWGDGHHTVGIHHLNHMDVHEGALLTALAARNSYSGEWIVSASMGEQFRSPTAYATADPDCSTCRGLVAETTERMAARG